MKYQCPIDDCTGSHLSTLPWGGVGVSHQTQGNLLRMFGVAAGPAFLSRPQLD